MTIQNFRLANHPLFTVLVSSNDRILEIFLNFQGWFILFNYQCPVLPHVRDSFLMLLHPVPFVNNFLKFLSDFFRLLTGSIMQLPVCRFATATSY